MFEKTLANHLARPRGVLGRLVARGMNSTNKQMNCFSVQSLKIEANQWLLVVVASRVITTDGTAAKDNLFAFLAACAKAGLAIRYNGCQRDFAFDSLH